MGNKKWRNTAEFAGVVAVVASLIFVGLELRQNTNAVETATIENLTNQSHDFFLLMDSSPDLSRIYDAGTKDLSNLDATELAQYMWIQNSRYLRYQTAFLQWRRGTLADEDWLFYRRFACGLAEENFWPRLRPIFLPAFVEHIESC